MAETGQGQGADCPTRATVQLVDVKPTGLLERQLNDAPRRLGRWFRWNGTTGQGSCPVTELPGWWRTDSGRRALWRYRPRAELLSSIGVRPEQTEPKTRPGPSAPGMRPSRSLAAGMQAAARPTLAPVCDATAIETLTTPPAPQPFLLILSLMPPPRSSCFPSLPHPTSLKNIADFFSDDLSSAEPHQHFH